MGRTVPSITILFYQEQKNFQILKRALSRRDQRAVEELFAVARLHLAPAAYAAHPLPIEILLLSMILEEHKKVMAVEEEVDRLESERPRSQDCEKTGHLGEV